MIAKCRLCEIEQELCNSHIIPEFFYKNIYNTPNKFCFTKINGRKILIKTEQKGLREYLLCKSCESTFSLWEKYAKDIFYPRNNKSTIELHNKVGDMNITINEFHSFDYDKFKLFLMSILWRISVSSEKFNTIEIAEEHIDILHNALKLKKPLEENEYPCFLQIIINEDNSYFDGSIIGPYETDYKGYKTVNILIDSFLFIFIIGELELNEKIQNIILNQKGIMSVTTKKILSDTNLMEMIKISENNYQI